MIVSSCYDQPLLTSMVFLLHTKHKKLKKVLVCSAGKSVTTKIKPQANQKWLHTEILLKAAEIGRHDCSVPGASECNMPRLCCEVQELVH